MAAVISRSNTRNQQQKRLSLLFQRQVAPELEGLEALRQQQRQRFLLAAVATIAAVVGVPYILWPLSVAWAGGAAIVLAIIGAVLLQHMMVVYQNAVRRVVMPAVCEAIGDITHATGSTPDLNFKTLKKIGLLPNHNRRTIDDVFKGQHRGTSFTMAEVKLRQRGSGHKGGSRTVFRGLVLAIRTPNKVPARILIAKDGGLIGNRFKAWINSFSGLQQVPLPHDRFEKCFELYADRPEVALETVTPSLCDSLAELAEAHQGAALQGAFIDHAFFLAMPKKADQFRVGSLFRSLDQLEAEVDGLLHDVQIVHRVIDYLYGDRPPLSRETADALPDPAPANNPPTVVRRA